MSPNIAIVATMMKARGVRLGSAGAGDPDRLGVLPEDFLPILCSFHFTVSVHSAKVL
jgi:hypothetical protein